MASGGLDADASICLSEKLQEQGPPYSGGRTFPNKSQKEPYNESSTPGGRIIDWFSILAAQGPAESAPSFERAWAD